MGGKRKDSRGVQGLLEASAQLRSQVARLTFSGNVAYVYNPLEYAWSAHETYVRNYGGRRGVTLLLGMNPGPWGMAQTGVPFGEVSLVRDWLGIETAIGKPEREHPKRPVEGFACRRSEVSGARLWGWARDRYRTPDAFFERFFVWNYCPLSFMLDSGANFTPDKLPAVERDPLFGACDRAMAAVVECLAPRAIIGIGKFAETRAKQALGETSIFVGTMLHPSPASPAANRGWAAQAEAQLEAQGAL